MVIDTGQSMQVMSFLFVSVECMCLLFVYFFLGLVKIIRLVVVQLLILSVFSSYVVCCFCQEKTGIHKNKVEKVCRLKFLFFGLDLRAAKRLETLLCFRSCQNFPTNEKNSSRLQQQHYLVICKCFITSHQKFQFLKRQPVICPIHFFYFFQNFVNFHLNQYYLYF